METVGVGQSELEIAEAADTTVVVLTPESGDSVQAMKAGLMEIADIFVINKADRRPEARRAASEIKTILRIRQGKAFDRIPAHHGVDLSEMARMRAAERTAGAGEDGGGARGAKTGADAAATHAAWEIPVLLTTGQEGTGVPELLSALDDHFTWLRETGVLAERRRRRLRERVRAVVDRHLRARVWDEGRGVSILEAAVADLESGRRTPYDVAGEILRAMGADDDEG